MAEGMQKSVAKALGLPHSRTRRASERLGPEIQPETLGFGVWGLGFRV